MRSATRVGEKTEWVKTAYAQGVPMGGDMQPMPASPA